MTLYETYSMYPVKDTPVEHVKSIVNAFMIDAGVNMGNDFTDNTLDRTIDIVLHNFSFLPVHYVGSAFKKGSLGHYGAGRLVPRVVYGWLNEITQEYNRDQDHKRLMGIENAIHFKDLDKIPFGKAINWKIEHLSKDEWDKVPLKLLAEMIGNHEAPTLQDFGIKR